MLPGNTPCTQHCAVSICQCAPTQWQCPNVPLHCLSSPCGPVLAPLQWLGYSPTLVCMAVTGSGTAAGHNPALPRQTSKHAAYITSQWPEKAPTSCWKYLPAFKLRIYRVPWNFAKSRWQLTQLHLYKHHHPVRRQGIYLFSRVCIALDSVWNINQCFVEQHMLSNIGNIFMMEHNLFRGEQKLSIFFIHFTSLIKTILTSSENKENIDPMNFLITSLQELFV